MNKTREELIRELKDQKQEFDSLKLLFNKSLADRNQIEYILKERLKELSCHDQIAEVMSNSELSIDEVCEKIVQILPASWQFPEIAEASIQIPNHVFSTPGYKPGKYSMVQDIKISQTILGQIEVCYPVDQIPAIDQLFLPEESSLLFSIAVKLGNYMEKKEKELALKVSEEKYKDLIENISDVIYTTDNQSNITFISPSITRLLGYRPEDIIGKNFSNFTGETTEHLKKRFEEIKDKSELQSEYQILSVTGEPHWIRFSSKAIKKDGSVRWVRSSTNATIKDGVMIGATGTMTDISERKLAESALLNSEEKFSKAFKTSPYAISITNAEDGTFFEVNESFTALTGYTKDEVYADSSIGLKLWANMEERNGVIADLNNGMEVLAREFKFVKKNGDIAICIYSASVISLNSKSYFLSSITDISDKKQAELQLLKLSRAVEQSPVSVVITDLDGNIEYANPKATETTGYTLDELKGQNPRVLKSGETPEGDYQYLWDSISHGNIWKGIFHNKRKNGELYWESSQITPVFDADRNIINYLAIKEDITGRKQIQEDLFNSERRFSEITEQSQNVIWETNSEAVYTFVSQASESAWGLNPSDLVGKKRFFDIHPEEGRKEFIDACLRQIQKGEQFRNMESLIQGDDGKMNWVMTNGMPYLDSEGNVKGYRGSSLNINQQKSAFEELRQSEERYKSIFRNNHSVMMIIDPETGDIKDVNSSACDYYKLTYDEMCSKNISEVNVLTRKEIKSEMQKAKEEKRTQFFFKHRLGNGEIRDVEVYSCPLKFGDSILLFSIVHDITERRLAEEALIKREQDLNFSQEIAGMGSWQIDMATNTSKWSDNMYRIFGLDPDKDKASQDLFFELIHPDDRHLIDEYIVKILRDRKQVTFEMRINLKSGKTIWIQNSMIPGFEGDQLVTLNGTNVDITEKKKSENELREQEEELNRAQRMAGVGSWSLDLLTTEMKWSENYYLMMGIPFGTEVKSEIFVERVHPDDVHLIDQYHEKMHRTKKPVNYDIRIRFDKNKYHWIQNNIFPFFENGEMVMLKGVFIDITEKKLVEEHIKNQNDTLKAILTAIPDLMFVIDKDGKYLEVFASENEKLLLSPDKIVGSNIEQVFSREMTDLLMEKIRASIQKRMVETIDYVISLANSPSTDFEARIVPIDQDKVLILARDVTEARQKDAEIKKLSLVVEQSPVIIVITDLEGNIEYVNPAFHAITGYEPDEVLGKNTRILKSGITDPKVYVNLWETITVGDNWYGEWINKKKNGELYWENVSITPIRDGNGKVTNYLAIKQDITHRKQTEEEINNLTANLEVTIVERTSELTLANYHLKDEIEERKRIENALIKSENSYRTVVENVNEVIFQTDAEGYWLFLNKSWEKVTGFSVEESLGQLFVNYVHPDDRARNWELFEPLISREKEYCRHEIRYLTKEGGFRWIEVFARLALNDENEIIGTFGTLHDITDRRQAETSLALEKQRLAYIIEGTNTGTWEWNIQTGETVFNERWAEILGYTLEELSPVSIETWVKLCHPDDLKISGELMEKHFKGELDYYSFETRMRHKTGDWVWVLDRGQVHNWDQDGKPLTMSGTHQDINERKLAEESLNQISTRLALALRAGKFGVWDYDVDNDVLYWDNQMFSIYGVREEDFSNAYDAWLNALHPDDKIRSDEEMQMAIRGEKEFNTEFKVVWPDGSVHYIRALSTVQRDNSGHALRVIGTNWDITLQKQAEDFENEILQLSTKLTGVTTSEIDSALKLALLRIGQFLNADRAYIFEFNMPDVTIKNTHEWCNEGIQPEIENLQDVPYNIFPNWMETLRAHNNVIIPSVHDLPENWQSERELLESQGIQSLVAIPLFVENNIIGFVGLDSVKSKRDYNSTEINILKVWSSMLASLINNQRSGKLLEQTRQNYETFFNTIDDFLFIFDEQGNIVDSNSTVKDRLGYSNAELTNKSVLMVRPPERREEALCVMQEILEGKAQYCSIPLITRSGEQIPVETRIKRGYWNGSPVIFGVSKDISQIRLSEQKFASAFHLNSAVMTITRFDDDQFVDVNNTFLSLLGYSREDIKGKTLVTLGIVRENSKEGTIQNAINRGIAVREIEIKAYSKSNESYIFLLSAEEIYIGSERCLLSVAVNITERKIMENELRKARKEADLANLAKSEFLSRMSHELRTPMNSILGFAQLLEMGELKTGQRKGVNHIMKSGKHLLDLINEVLDISKIEAGHLSLSLEPVQLSGVIPEMIDLVKPQIIEHQIRIDLIDAESNRMFVKSDRKRLKQIILNLLNNAIKYNRESGSIWIKTELRPVDESGATMLRISITDTGLGISEEDLPKLFTPFERIGAEKSATEGTGLGLSVVKKLIEAMSGKLGVESQPGSGSTFWIELPNCENPLEHSEKLSILLNDSEPKLNDLCGTILYIEDNASNIELVGQILINQRSGVKLIYNMTGAETVQLAIENMPDLILLDLNLPDMHGNKVLDLLLAEERTRNIPVVVISADAMPQQLQRLLKGGAKDYLTKPLDIQGFLMIIDKYIPHKM